MTLNNKRGFLKARMKKIKKLSEINQINRLKWKKQKKNVNLSLKERRFASLKLQKNGKNKSMTRHVRCCPITGRCRGTIRIFGNMCRQEVYKRFRRKQIPGFFLASW